MCNFWSCIVTRNGEVLFDEMSDLHEDIIEKYKLVDDTADPALLKFARPVPSVQSNAMKLAPN